MITFGQTKSDNINRLLLFNNRWVVNGTVKWDHIELMITLPSGNIKRRSLYKNFISHYVSGLGKFLFGTSSMYEPKKEILLQMWARPKLFNGNYKTIRFLNDKKYELQPNHHSISANS